MRFFCGEETFVPIWCLKARKLFMREKIKKKRRFRTKQVRNLFFQKNIKISQKSLNGYCIVVNYGVLLACQWRTEVF